MRASRLAAVALAALEFGCGSTPTSPPPPPPPPPPPAVTGLAVAPTTVTLTGVGAQASLQATLSPSNATGTVTWRTDDPAIATVAGSGTTATVTAVARGNTRAVAAVGSVEGSAAIAVSVPSVTAIAVTPARDTILPGATRQFAAAVTADNGVDPSVTWSTGTPAVATISAAGLATAVTSGSTTVIATSVATPATAGTATLVVRAPAVANVTVTPGAATLLVAETVQLTATVTADPGLSTNVSWTSSSVSAATVSPTGLVTAVAPGATTVTAASVADPSRAAAAQITVSSPTPLTSWTQLTLGDWDRSHYGLIDGLHSLGGGAAFAEPWPGGIGNQTITRRVGGVWGTEAILPFDQLNVVGGAGNDVWIGSTTGRLARWTGAAFVETPSGIVGPVVGIGGAGSGNFVAGVNNSSTPRVLLYQAGSWSVLPAATPLFLTSVAGRAADDLIATFLGGSVLGRWNGTAWSFTPSTGFNLVAGEYDAGGAPVVGGSTGGSARWTGTAWEPLTVPAARAGAAAEPFRNIVRCGGQLYSATPARIFRLDGTAWTTIADYGEGPLGSNSHVLGCGGDDVLRAGGTDGSIARWSGSAWVQEAFEPQIYGVAAVSSQRAWAVGASGVVFRWDGAAWQLDHHDFTAFRFFSVTALPGDFVMVAGGSGPRGIWRRQGGTWTLDPTPSDAVSVWAASPTVAFAAAAGGLLRWDGSSWSTIAAPAGTFFNRVAGASETFAVASGNAGINGRLAKWDGTSWTAMPMPAVGLMQDVAVVSPTAAFAVGQGFVLRWNGTTWISLALPAFMTSGGDLFRVAAVSATEAYVTNLAGAVFRFDGINWSQTTQLGLADVPANRFVANAIAVVPGFGLIGTTGGGIFRGHPGIFAAPRR